MIITITCKEGRKVIDQFDVDLPSLAMYIAQDEDGCIDCYFKKPYLSQMGSYWIGGPAKRLFTNLQPNPDWKDSLIKVGDIK